MKVLFIVPYAPTRIRTRPFHFIRALRSGGHEVTVATLWSSEEERQALQELATVASDVVAERLPVGRSLWNCVRALPGSEPLQAHFSWCPRLASRLRQLVADSPFDVVHVEHLRGAGYGLMLGRMLSGRLGRPALVWDSVDCISTLFNDASRESPVRRVRLAARLELARTERYEASAVSHFDRVIVTSERDRQDLLRLALGRTGSTSIPRIEVVPNGVDLDYFSPPSAPREPLSLVITGKMSYHANATAVSRVVQDIMPAVWAELPAVRLWVVGKDPTSEVLKLGQRWSEPFTEGPDARDRRSRVLVTGTVGDVRPFLRRATLALAPIPYGVGIQNKVLEAMACGTPVVATPQAAAGLDARPGEELALATISNGFARTVITLLKDEARRARLGRAGRAFVERQHNWQDMAARVAHIYRHARA